MKYQKNTIKLLIVVIILSFCTVIVIPNIKINFFLKTLRFSKELGTRSWQLKLGQSVVKRELSLKKGLDLQGGVQLIYDIDMSGINPGDREDAFLGVRSVMERRVNLFGVSEANVQTVRSGEKYRLSVEIPGVYDVEQALEVIGKMAKLDFRTENPTPPETETTSTLENNFTPSGLTGANLKKARMQFDPQTGEPTVAISFNEEGTKLFEKLTSDNIGKPLAIFLDDQLLTAPTVKSAIPDGNAIISGSFTMDSAKELAIQLNGGALPAPVKVQEQRTVGPSLGEESVNASLTAGLIGLLLVAVFMVFYYGVLGFFAVLSLVAYALITLTLYILMPVTLTLPGIAGFLLSVGMAVDSTILIFSRLKEELRAGVVREVAIEMAFGRAWDSIRDANINTLIICFVLFNPLNWQWLNASGMVRGFALTLAMGIFIGLFTGIVIVRTLIRMFYFETAAVPYLNLPQGTFGKMKSAFKLRKADRA